MVLQFREKSLSKHDEDNADDIHCEEAPKAFSLVIQPEYEIVVGFAENNHEIATYLMNHSDSEDHNGPKLTNVKKANHYS